MKWITLHQQHTDALGEQEVAVWSSMGVCRQSVPCLHASHLTAPALMPSKKAASSVRGLPANSSTYLEKQPLEAPQLGLLLRIEVVQVGGVDQVQPQPHIPSVGEVALALQACKSRA